jgi:hypothetical protein
VGRNLLGFKIFLLGGSFVGFSNCADGGELWCFGRKEFQDMMISRQQKKKKKKRKLLRNSFEYIGSRCKKWLAERAGFSMR